MIYCKTADEIELIRKSSLIAGKAIAEVAKLIKPGVKTIDLDKRAYEFIMDQGAVPSFLNYEGFPNSLCISVNEQVVHGIPGQRVLVDGDIVSVDCGVYKNEFHGDMAYTFTVGEVEPEIMKLIRVTKECLLKGIEKATLAHRIGDLAFAIQEHAEKNGFGVVRELVGHGVGKKLHEKPEVPNYGKRGTGTKFIEGMVIAIEPMINLGKKEVITDEDGWTIVARDRKPSAHFEHTVAIGKNKADVLSTFADIEKVLEDQGILENIYGKTVGN